MAGRRQDVPERSVGASTRSSLLLSVILLLLTVPPIPLHAQDGPQTTIARPQRQYDAGWFHRALFGGLNRDLWSLDVEAPVLDLSSYAGGLTPLRRGGGLQTTSLRFEGADGQRYTFRSLDKDATRNLDPQLRQSIAAQILQDQIAALFPLSAMVVAPLLRAADVLHASPDLVVMPSDPALGEFRSDFEGLLGWIEVRPDEGPDGEPGFAGADRVVNSETFLERLERTPRNQIDARGYLRARLMDLFVGDWDRHPDQWRWAGFEEGDEIRWEPIPRDRDWALANIDGLFLRLGRSLWPHYVGFSDRYESVFGTTWNGRALDRHLLAELDRDDWAAVARDLQDRLSDEVIRSAVGRLPASYEATVGADLEAALLGRRDRLHEAAMEFYGILSGWVDIFGTDEDELVRLTREDDGTLSVVILEDETAATPFFSRRFDPDETREVRVFMRGGDDRVVVDGAGASTIGIRLVGGGSDDLYIATDTEGVHIYDDRGANDYTRAQGASIDESDYEEPEDTESATHQARPRDWGSRWFSFPLIGASSDIGMFVGVVAWRDTYGFRHFPYQTELTFTTALNPVELGVEGGVALDFPIARGGPRGVLAVEGTTREVLHYFGAGNESVKDAAVDLFRADRGALGVSLTVEPDLRDAWSLSVGPSFTFSKPVGDKITFVTDERPYGFDEYGQVGLLGELGWDSRDSAGYPSRGGLLAVEGRYYPGMLDVEDAYGGLRGHGSLALRLGGPVLALHASVEKVWGDYPHFDGARLGGAGSLRGFAEDRFVGDASVLTGAELRIPVAKYFLLFPGQLGVHGMIDAGRVFLKGEDSDTWHTAVGGGLWATILDPKYTIGLTVARSDEGAAFYLAMGFGR